MKRKKRIYEILKKKLTNFDVSIEDNSFNLFRKNTLKQIGLFITKSISSSIILLLTILILIAMFSPFIKSYLNGPDSSEHFNKIFQKLGVSICVDKKCVNPND